MVTDKPLVNMTLAAENLSDAPLTVTFEQSGPIGIPREQMQYDMRRLMAAFKNGGGAIKLSRAKNREAIHKSVNTTGQPFVFAPDEKQTYAWTALTNRFFAVFTRPLPRTPDSSTVSVFAIAGTIAAPAIPDTSNPGDMQAQITMSPVTVVPGEQAAQAFEIFAGPKDPDTLAVVNPAFADPTKVGYHLAQFADRSCMCTFGWLTQLMAWLMHGIQHVVRNYGIAIIILVVIIRTVMHPLTVFQQKSMIKTQEGMARIQPKMDAIKEKYANDKQKQNQETMKLFSEEGVNPAASFVSMIPMLIQMPILVAMWISLNSDVALRHQPFMLWMHDLSAPDALITFGGDGLTIPILGQLISWFRNIPTLNVLPILMGVSMYVQQKYMPKPAQAAKREAAREKAAAAGTESKVEMQLKQQHMMAVMMSFLFPLMFYYMPSGLNLYWMSTNVFGIFETLLVRRQLAAEKERREQGGPPPIKGPRKPGPIGRFLKHLAEQAEEIQRKADEMSQQQPAPRKKSRDADDKKKAK
ncbi:MAG: YidC/Oxa1 family insertase periplasmic-domain containing protein, partial [Phycisphaerae bacterium]|nr:YidC/Oxa1 family insertase periplasmic-domain containing protein [Phycisphaerae bacterium]